MPCEDCGPVSGCAWCDDGAKSVDPRYRCTCTTPCWNPDCDEARRVRTEIAMLEEMAAMEPQTEDPMIAALLRERAGYVTRGLNDRVAQVDEQLAQRGHTPDAATEGATSRETPPKNRRQRRTEQA